MSESVDRKNSAAAALMAAESWLELIDRQAYGESWDRAAAYFQSVVTRPQWQKQVNASRQPLGKLVRRTLVSQSQVTDLPDAPAGNYVVFEFSAAFADEERAETVTPMLESDNSWRVSGYFIR